MSKKNNSCDSVYRMKWDNGDNSKLANTPGDSLHLSSKYFNSYLHSGTNPQKRGKKAKRSIANDHDSVVDESEDKKEANFSELGLPESTKLNKSLNVNIYLYGSSQQSGSTLHSNSGIGHAKLKQRKKDREQVQGKTKLPGSRELSRFHEKISDSSSRDELARDDLDNQSSERRVTAKKFDTKSVAREFINNSNLDSHTLTTSTLQTKDSVHSISRPTDSKHVKNIQDSHSNRSDLKSWSPRVRLTLTPNIYIHGLSQGHPRPSDNSDSEEMSKTLGTNLKPLKKNRDVDKIRSLDTAVQDNPKRLGSPVNEEKLFKSTSDLTGKLLKKSKPVLDPLNGNIIRTSDSPAVLSESLAYQRNVYDTKTTKPSTESPIFESHDKFLQSNEAKQLYKAGTSSISSAIESSVSPNNEVTSHSNTMSNSDEADTKPLISVEVQKDIVKKSKPLLTLPPNPYIHGFTSVEKSLTKSKPKLKTSTPRDSNTKHSKASTRTRRKDENKSQKFAKRKQRNVDRRNSKVLSQLNTGLSQPMESSPKKTQLSLQDFGFSSSYQRGLKREISVEDSPKPVHYTPKAPTRRNLMRINLNTLTTSPVTTHELSTTHANHLLSTELLNSPTTSMEPIVHQLHAPSIEASDSNDLVIDLEEDNDPSAAASAVKSEPSDSHVLTSFDQLEKGQTKIKSSSHSKNIFSLMNEMYLTSELCTNDNEKTHPLSNPPAMSQGAVSQGGASSPEHAEDKYIDWNSKIKSASLSSELKEIFNTYCVRKSERVQERKKKNSPENGVIIADDNSASEELLTFHKSSGWTFSYPIGVDPGLYKACPEINYLYGEWMQSARGFDFYDMSCNHASPRADRRPTTLLIKELILLLQCSEAVVRDKANYYLREWLALHPPVTPETIKLYTEAFSLSPSNTFLMDTIKSCMEKPEPFISVWLVEFCVLMFEINFDHCLRQGDKKILQSSMIIKWLWISPHSVFHSSSTSQLLRLLEDVITSPEPNFPLCVALCSLISMAAECVRLASVRWNPEDLNFVSDPALALSHDLAKKLQHCLSVRGFDTAALVISSVKLCWLRTLVVAVILSSYNNYLISERIHVNKISLSSIVSQYFFLVPPLQECSFTERSLMNASSSNHSDKSSASSLSDSICPPQKNGLINSKQKTLKVNKRNGLGESAVHVACKRNNVEKLQQLLTVPGVDVNLKDNIGWTPLHEACHHGSYDCVMLLLKYVPNTTISSALEQEDYTACKVDLNAIGPDGVTPLIDAVEKNHVEICRQLLKYGGQQLLNAKNTEGWTALDLAYTSEMREVLNDVTLSDSVLELDQGSSEETFSQSVCIDIQSIHETAPLSSLYEEVIGAKYVFEKDCADFLSLLTSLVSSYYMSMPSHPSNHSLHERDASVLRNMKGHVKLLKRHIKKLTKPEDYKSLLFQVELLELVCLSKL
ncbi:unnamed protein product [Lymnaea stagnalis]|uniref:Uncharacterized protein n=1 Tax=Lymnaea stagnalis TaxID=6523 RepID=A0AAV2HEG8_LYMST